MYWFYIGNFSPLIVTMIDVRLGVLGKFKTVTKVVSLGQVLVCNVN